MNVFGTLAIISLTVTVGMVLINMFDTTEYPTEVEEINAYQLTPKERVRLYIKTIGLALFFFLSIIFTILAMVL